MRTVKLELNPAHDEDVISALEVLNKIEILTTFMLSPGRYVNIWRVWARDSRIKELGASEWIERITVLAEGEDECLCLVEGNARPIVSLVMDYGCYFDFPITIEKEKVSLSIVGEAASIASLVRYLRGKKDFNIISVKNYSINHDGLADTLTERQQEVLEAAFEGGYFDLPRRKTSSIIARELGISHSTFLEHLRKAVRRIIIEIFE